MNNLINAIKLALLGSDVESIVKSFAAHHAKLQKLAERLRSHEHAKREAADRLLDQADAHRTEADRANRVAQRVADLLR
jgi:ATP-dependent protease HslVU (ClpYQ) ATPase subunit